MKFTKHQKEIIKRIYTGDINDIFSYIKYFNLGYIVKFDKREIHYKFTADNIPKKYYCPDSLNLNFSNVLTELDYNKKLQSEEINPNSYSSYDLQLNYNSGIKHEYWEGAEYCLNFYNGVYIAKCFDDILEFLILWQFLVSEMLILEVPQTLLPTTIGLFYIKDHNFRNESLLLDEKIKSINLENFSCDDLYYLPENYILSKEHCLMCKEYLNKKIYPSAKLGLFIGKHFSTYEEITQQKALFIAWLAIFVSIALTFAPLYLQKDNSNIDVIIQNLNDIKSSVNKIQSFEDLSIKIDIIIDKLNILSDKISSKNINIDFVESDIASKQ